MSATPARFLNDDQLLAIENRIVRQYQHVANTPEQRHQLARDDAFALLAHVEALRTRCADCGEFPPSHASDCPIALGCGCDHHAALAAVRTGEPDPRERNVANIVSENAQLWARVAVLEATLARAAAWIEDQGELPLANDLYAVLASVDIPQTKDA